VTLDTVCTFLPERAQDFNVGLDINHLNKRTKIENQLEHTCPFFVSHFYFRALFEMVDVQSYIEVLRALWEKGADGVSVTGFVSTKTNPTFGIESVISFSHAIQESQRIVPKPRVARHELPWVSVRKKFPTATRLRPFSSVHRARYSPQPRLRLIPILHVHPR